MKFEESFNRLKEISSEMEKNDLPLEEAINLYSEAAKLFESCKKDIETAKLKVTKE